MAFSTFGTLPSVRRNHAACLRLHGRRDERPSPPHRPTRRIVFEVSALTSGHFVPHLATCDTTRPTHSTFTRVIAYVSRMISQRRQAWLGSSVHAFLYLRHLPLHLTSDDVHLKMRYTFSTFSM